MKRNVLLNLLAATSLILFGCGSDDDDNSVDGGTDSDIDGDGECYDGDYTINTSEDIEFISSFSCIEGALTIEETDLVAVQLPNLISVSGKLEILANPVLENIDGLSGLTSVGLELFIVGNDTLASIDGLSSIASIGESLWIRDNPNVPCCEVCDLLDQLVDFTGDVQCDGNHADECWVGNELDCP